MSFPAHVLYNKSQLLNNKWLFSYANSKHRAANLAWWSLAYNRANFKFIQPVSLFAWVNTRYLALLLILYMWIFEMYRDKIVIAYKCSSWAIKTQVRKFHAYRSSIVFIDILCKNEIFVWQDSCYNQVSYKLVS